MTRVRCCPPAKLNLFLEIPARRADGYHQIDTVMTAIDWRDELEIQSVPEPGVQLDVRWLPSAGELARQLGWPGGADSELPPLLALPPEERNLVHRALQAFRRQFGIESGFRVQLGKRIPAGAGLGGASSDAAHALVCAAHLHQLDKETATLHALAASIGSDVPFFLPSFDEFGAPVAAAHAGGRGEVLTPLRMRTPIHFVVAFPPVSLSTAAVYRKLNVPRVAGESGAFQAALAGGEMAEVKRLMFNRLSEPALRIAPRLGDLLESLWQSGLQPCQLTGSGSACFGLARDAAHAEEALQRLKIELQPGALLRATHSVAAAATIATGPS